VSIANPLVLVFVHGIEYSSGKSSFSFSAYKIAVCKVGPTSCSRCSLRIELKVIQLESIGKTLHRKHKKVENRIVSQTQDDISRTPQPAEFRSCDYSGKTCKFVYFRTVHIRSPSVAMLIRKPQFSEEHKFREMGKIGEPTAPRAWAPRGSNHIPHIWRKLYNTAQGIAV